MALSKRDQRMVNLLYLVKARIARGDSEFICWAADAIEDQGDVSRLLVHDLKKEVMYRLGLTPGCYTYEHWLKKNGYAHTYLHQKAGRIAWIDDMISNIYATSKPAKA